MRQGVRVALWIAALTVVACGEESTGDGTNPIGTGGSVSGGQGGAGASSGAGGMMPNAGAAGTVPGSGGVGGSGGAPPVSGSGGSGGSAPTGGGGGSSGSGGSAPDSGTDPAPGFPPVSDLKAAGPYTPAMIAGSGPGGGYTVFHPQELGPDGLKNPIATWGNGATTVPGLFVLLPHLASHGFVIIASDNAFVTGEELRAGIDWLFDQNTDSSSMFYEKLDTANVASFGYSLGSLGTFEIADDPRLTTTVHISGGAMNKAVVPNLKHPTAFFCGDASDIAYANCESDFELATVPVFYGVFPGDHLGILGAFAEPINEVVTGWFRWRLMHDDTLESMFVGPDCTVCKDAGWTVKQKDFDVAP
jgi:hypothetical protein